MLRLVTFAKTSSSLIALLGGAFLERRSCTLRLQGHWGAHFEGRFWVDFWLRFALTAMGISFLEGILVFVWFLYLFCYASRATGESGLEV